MLLRMADYISINKTMWNERAPAHAASVGYGFDRFIDDPAHLSGVVRFDRPWLGDLTDQCGAHLQCHIGTDTVSLARLGARMTGLDFSPVAVLGPAAFDFVYTGVGALCWLPDVSRWARVVADLLRPGGRLFIREGHPMLWALDGQSDALTLRYPYFEHAEPVVTDESGTYVQTDVVFTHRVSHCWNHGLGEIITAVLDAGMRLTALVEHCSVPWEAFPGHMVVDDVGEWRLDTAPDRLAGSYTMQAIKG
jgi:SAM-dependent methyltransferase